MKESEGERRGREERRGQLLAREERIVTYKRGEEGQCLTEKVVEKVVERVKTQLSKFTECLKAGECVFRSADAGARSHMYVCVCVCVCTCEKSVCCLYCAVVIWVFFSS